MRRYLLIVCILLFGFSPGVRGQGDQVLNNGQNTGIVNFSGCVYNWTNDKPGIGLSATGTGNINSFTAVNTGNTPVVATINATAIPVENAYIASSDNPGVVSVINTSTNVVTATITVGNGPTAVSASPDGSRVYIANSSSNTVSVINTTTNTVVATVIVGNMPYAISVSYDGSKVFVGNLNDGTVSVIATATNTVVATIPGFTQLNALTASPTGNLLYVVNGTTAIAVVNTASNTIVKNITVGFSPWEIAVSPDGTRVYVSNLGNNTVSVIDAASNTVIANIPVDMLPEGITVSPDGKLLYVGCFGANTVDVINTGSNVILRKINATAPHGLSVTPDGKELYVVNNNNPGSVTVFNAASGATITTVPTGADPVSFGNFIAAVSCSPVKFTITVNPTPAFTPTITTGPATGSISACKGTASVSPQVQQIKVAGAAISGNITATAPAGFEISLSGASGFSSSLTLVPAAGTVNAVIYVRSAATAATGTITGNVTLAATGAITQNVIVTGFVNALPAVNNVPDQYINTGSPTTAVAFAGTGNAFNWTNSTPGIGLAATGTGDIASFTAVNTGSNPVTATITATPVNANYAYVPDAFSNDVLLINTGTNTVDKTIPVGKYPTNVVFVPNKNVAYISNSNDNTLSEINTLTQNVIATVPGFVYPWGLAASPDGNRLYVVNLNAKTISVLNTQTNALISTISLSIKPAFIAINPDGSQLYLTDEYGNNVLFINTTTYATTATIPVGGQPENMALNADGSRLYVANTNSKSVSVINTQTGKVIGTIPTPEAIYSLVVSPDGSKLYMIGGDFMVANTATYQTTTTIPLTPSFSYGMSITADGKLVYVANTSYGTVSVVDTNTDTVIAKINAGTYPIADGAFVTQNATCPGAPVKFNITVYPAPAAPPTITPGIATGAISACAGTASVAPQIQQFTVSGSGLTANISVLVTAGFEISLSKSSGYLNRVMIPATAGAANTIVYVRSSATAAAGNINGTVTLTSAGATTQYTAVNGVISALPVANAPASQTLNNGNPTTAINFAGTGNSLDWTNDTPSIGLAGSGTGDIPSFTAVNNGPNPVIATITATPKNAGFAYITNYSSNTVSVLSTSSNAVVATIPVDAGPWAVSVNADGTRAYITDIIAGTVSVINTAANAVIATVTVGSDPDGICVSPDGSKVYVTNLNSTTVSVINTATNTIASTITGLSGATGITISPDGSKLYVVNSANNQVMVINTATNAVIANIPIGTGGNGIAISPDGSRLYVANDVSNNVTIINALTNTAITTIVGGINPFGVVVSPDGTRVYVTNENDTNISVIDAATNTVVSNINAGSGFSGISITSDGKDIFAVNGTNIVEDIDVSTGAVKATYTVGNHPIGFGNFITKSGCTGVPVTATITVNPGSVAPPTITPGAATGSISACAGTASALPLIQEITIIGSDLTGDITATAPAGFEVSINEFSGYSNTAVLTQFGGAVGSGVFVRSAATAPAGNISGKVTLTSPGATTQQIAVAGIVNAVPKVNAVSNQVYTTGSLTTGATFTGGASNFTWVNDTPGIGLAASGSGNITPFTAVNNGSSPVVANITVTPVNSGAAYIPNSGDGTVSIINTSTNTIEGVVKVGANPTAAAVSPDGSKVFVANQNDNTISVIDVASGAVITAIPYGSSPNSIAITPDGSTIYVTDHVSNALAVISTSYYQVLTDIIVGLGDFGVVVSQDGSHVYVANTVGNSVSVINTANNTVVATISVPNAPRDVAVSPDGSKLYVTNSGSNTVTVINTGTNTISGTITVGSSPDGITVSGDGKQVYVANNGSATVSVINSATGAVTATIPVGSGPSGIALTQGSVYAYVTNLNDNTVSVINTATNKVIATVNVGSAPISFGNFIAPSNGCPGVPAKFTITVNPSQANAPTVTASTVTGTITACAGTASVSPLVQQFTVSGTNLIDNITASVPSAFEISTSPNSGFSGAVVLPQTGGNVSATVLYIRSSASAAVGTSSGYVTLSSTGWLGAGNGPQITETINALPTANPVSNQIVNNGASTTAVSLTGTGNTFTWTNDTPAIGLPATGAGDIASFTAINTGSSPIVATISATPVNGGFAYLTRDDGTVAVLNTTSGQVVGSLTAGQSPAGVIMAPGGGRAYIANLGSSTISMINTTTNKVTRTMPVSGGNPMGMAASKNGKFLYVADETAGQVSVISLANGTEITTIPIGSNAYGLALSPDDSRLYATNFTGGLGFVSVINTATNTVITKVNTELYPTGIAVSPDGSRVYAVDQISGAVSIINTATNTILATVNVGKGATGIVVSPDGSRVYVSNSGEGTVSVINAATNTETLKIVVGSNPVGISVNADGSLVYVANTGSQNLSVINTATGTVVNTISIPHLSQSFGNFIQNGSGCQGTPAQFTITVNPSAGASPIITASAATGSISACAGTASISPQLQQITISGSFLKSDITVTAPAGFEISVSPNSGYASLLTIKQSGGIVGNTIIYVRSSATAPTGNISGNITLQSFSATSQTIAVSGVVNPLPNINPVSNQTVTNGQTTTAINFTGIGSFTWTNDTPGIGLAASGNGNIAAFTAVNTGTTPITANVAVTAKSPGYAYITGGGHTGLVYVVNTATQAVVATVPVGSRPFAVAFSPSGDKVYVTNDSTDYVSVIDTKTNKVVDTMYVGVNMLSTCISPDGKTLYVTYNYGIAVINTSTGQQITKIFDRSLTQIIASPDGQYVYATNYDFNEVDVISTATNTIIKKIDVGFYPDMLVLSPDEKTLYVTAMGNFRGVVAIVDLPTATLVSSIPLGARTDGITITPDGKKLYVTEIDSNKVAVINTATNQIEKTIAVGSYPQGTSITGDGSEVYITNVNSNDVTIINTATDQVVKTIPNIKLPVNIGNFIAPTPNCASQPLKFTITVNPTPAQVPTITATTATGSIAACVGSASVSPQIQQFTVSGKYLAGDITATAPSGFEVSLSPGSGYGPNVKLTQASGTVNNTLIYVRSSASAPAGDLNGAIVLTTTTTTQFVDVHGIVNALATVNPVANQVVANGATTAAVNFGGTGNSFSWTNDTPGIGIAAGSTGDIPTFTAHNFGTTPIVATFTVTPEKDALAYITSASDGNVSVINTVTNKIIATIPVGNFPFGTAASTDGRVYVSNLTSNSISVISTATNTVIATIPVPADPEGIAVSPDGNTVYVLGLATQVLSVIDTRTYTVTTTLPVGRDTQYLALSPDGTKLFIANTAEFNLSVFDTKTNTIISTIPLTFPPYGIAAGMDNNTIYVDDSDNGKLVAVNSSTKQVVASVAVGLEPRGVMVSPDGSRVYVGNTGENTVSVVDISANTVIATLAVGLAPQGMSVTGDGKYVYVASQDASNVSVINTSTNTVVNTITVGSGPYSIGNFITPGIACPGPPATFTITVNPTPSTSPDITSTVATGTNTACQGTASVSPNIQQVQVSGTNLTGAVSLTAPNGFEISLSATSGFGNSLTITPVGGVVNNVIVYVRLSATALAGSNSGNIEGTSPGARTIEIPVTGMVNALPVVNTIANQTVINGNTTAAVNFTGTGNIFNWTNDSPGIGLPATGAGDISSFNAINTGSSPVTATITVTPVSGSFAYIANNATNGTDFTTPETVSVINTANNTVVATITVGVAPWGVSVSPDGKRLYVANDFSNNVSVINTSANSVAATIPVGTNPEGIVVAPDGSHVYVANANSNNLSVISTASNSVTSIITVGTAPNAGPNRLTVSPDGKYVYALYQTGLATGGHITVVNTATNTVASVIPLPTGYLADIAISPDGKQLYVTDDISQKVYIVNTATQVLTASVTAGSAPAGVALNPNGSFFYVTDVALNSVLVFSTATNTLVATIQVGQNPNAISVTADGNYVYVENTSANTVSVISTATNQVVKTVTVGAGPDGYGNFISRGTGCTGLPATFTITVNPTPSQTPGIDVTQATGSILTCEGTASASPNIQQFTASGTSLTAPIVLTAPNNFEISLSPGSGYTNTITLPLTGGAVSPTIIYVRIASTSSAGPISGNVSLISTGVLGKKVPVFATVNAAPTVRPVAPQTFSNGATTTVITISGIATDFTWTNDTPAIGLPASGSGSIAPFTAVNTGTIPVIATITVTPNNSGTGCSGVPVTFTITVDPTLSTAVNATGVLTGLNTIYGTPSASESFSVSGTALTSGILVTPPLGFELSTDNINFTSTVTVGSGGNISPQTVYIRLAAVTPVGSYSGNIKVTSPGASEFDLFMPLSTVTPALLAIAADDKSKTFNTPNPPLTASYIGFVNNETVADLVAPPVLATTAVFTSPIGKYPITASGASSPNYTISYLDGTLTILPTEQSIFIPNTFTPNGDGINDTWNIRYLDTYVNCSVDIFTRWGQRIFTSIGYGNPWDGNYNGKQLPVGTYYYVINLKNGLEPLAGFVALIR